MQKQLTKALRLTALCGAALLGGAGSANAAYVVINADPVYGAQFPDLGWRAVGALYIPDLCLSYAIALNTPPWIAINPLTVNFGVIDPLCSASRIQDVKLQFYSVGTGAVVETLNIGAYETDESPANFNRDLTIQELISFTLRDGKLDGFRTTLSTPMQFLAPLAGGGSKCFALEFSSATARVESFDYNATNEPCATTMNGRPPEDANNPLTDATVTWNRNSFIADLKYSAPDFAAPPPRTVPEPSGLALVMLALGAAAAAARRRV